MFEINFFFFLVFESMPIRASKFLEMDINFFFGLVF